MKTKPQKRATLTARNRADLFMASGLIQDEISTLWVAPTDEDNAITRLQRIQRLIFNVLIDQPQCLPTEFNLFDYVCTNNRWPPIAGVFCQNGKQIATDNMILIILQKRYPKSRENQLIDRTGAIIYPSAGHFPDYEKSLPSADDQTRINLSAESLKRALHELMFRRFQEENKIVNKFSDRDMIRIAAHVYAPAKYIYLLYKAMPVIDVTKFSLDASQMKLYAQGKHGSVLVMMMPRLFIEDDIETFNIVSL